MLKTVSVSVEDVYVPTGLRKERDDSKVDEAAESLMEGEDIAPIHVRKGKGRYVLIKGLHRLEAAKSLGEVTIDVFVIAARKH